MLRFEQQGLVAGSGKQRWGMTGTREHQVPPTDIDSSGSDRDVHSGAAYVFDEEAV